MIKEKITKYKVILRTKFKSKKRRLEQLEVQTKRLFDRIAKLSKR